MDIFVEEGELSDDQDVTLTNLGQGGIQSYMGWNPDMDTSANNADNNPFTGPKVQTPGKISVQMSTDDWLFMKLSNLNITLVEGYPSRNPEAGGLLKDQFVQPAKSQAKWYELYSNHKGDSTVSSWSSDASRLNSTCLRIAKQAGIASNPPQSCPLSQESLQKWEKSAKDTSVICNQAASFNHCLFKVQQGMQTQLKAIRTEGKGKSASRVAKATDEVQCLMDFSIRQAITMDHGASQ